MPASGSPPKTPDVALIGLGNWGTSLAHALLHAKIPLREVLVRRANPRHSVGLPITTPITTSITTMDRALLSAKVIWLCVPDRAVESTAAQLASRHSLRGQIVVHSSGALTVDALAAARSAGAQVAAVHPVMTFPKREPVPLTGVLFGVETSSASARRLLNALLHRLGGQVFRVNSSRKALYHAAGTLASPLLVSALTTAIETARAAGLSQRDATTVVQSLAEATLRNVFTRGPRESFSGPFARGDAATVKLHLQALAGHPMLADVYRSLARQAITSLPVRNRRDLALAVSGKVPGSSRRAQR